MKSLFVIIAAALAACESSSYAADTAGTPLFNGRDLTGWTGDPKIWSVQDGVIIGRTTPEVILKANTFLIWTNGTVKDFELTCSYRLTPSQGNKFANSGIQYRSTILDEKTWAVGGYQADMEAGPNYSGILYEEKMTRGIMAQRGEKVRWNSDCKKEVTGNVGDSAEIQKSIVQGGWNQYRIVAVGNHITHYINGKQTVDVTDECAKAAMEGMIALQMHVGTPFTAEFKDIRLKKL